VSLVTEHCAASSIVQPLVNAMNNSNNRAKPALLVTLSELLEEVHATRPSLINKYVVPLVLKLADEPNSEVRTESHKLIRRLHVVVGSLLLDYTPASKVQKVLEILNDK
jgi:hypothetical protein